MTGLRMVIDAVGTYLTGVGIAFWPGTDGEYPESLTKPPVFAKRLPPTPVEAVAINAYSREQSPNPGDNTIRVCFQVRTRAPYDADPLADAVVHALHGLHHQTCADLTFDRVRHLSTAQLGLTDTGADERTDNFEALLQL
ncbi:hypothetical protein G7Y41_08765 [Schaalia sp. ZJ405]|uniref:phage tail terminator protein n=1 Tax=Schaalia sp. ZJ405 TaxID=2709403 RepID=UPI0013EAD047|nr:minor capsid protein [Schaalia sp. ZJ405]QPK81116.1 hypothetical protein G7Y41_08765 [Schaalia sp. ZJ405]